MRFVSTALVMMALARLRDYERMRGKPDSPWQIRLPKDLGGLPACQTILNAIGNLFADRCQVEQFLFAEDIFGFFSKLTIHHRLVPEEMIPIHACHCAETSPDGPG